MGAITDLFNSERGLLAVIIIIAATALCLANKLAVADWSTFTQFIFAAYVGGKTITGVAQIIKNPPTGVAAAPVVEVIDPAGSVPGKA